MWDFVGLPGPCPGFRGILMEFRPRALQCLGRCEGIRDLKTETVNPKL